MPINILWPLGTALATYTVSALFAGRLKLKRNVFLFFYVPVCAGLTVGYYSWSSADPISQMAINWYWAILAIAVASFIAIRNVVSQPSSERRNGAGFALDLLWPGPCVRASRWARPIGSPSTGHPERLQRTGWTWRGDRHRGPCVCQQPIRDVLVPHRLPGVSKQERAVDAAGERDLHGRSSSSLGIHWPQSYLTSRCT